MVLILTNLSLDEFMGIEDKRQYALDCNYFSLNSLIGSKKELFEWLNWVSWYFLWENNLLYVSVLTDNYWTKHCGNLENSAKFTNWKTVPKSTMDADNSKYSLLPSNKRIGNQETVDKIIEELKLFNFKKSPHYTIKIG